MSSRKFAAVTVSASLILSFAFVQAAQARAVSITNATDQDLVFKLRCNEPINGEWKSFEAVAGYKAEYNHKGCMRYSFEMTTKKPGSEVKVKYSFPGGTKHKLVYNASKNAFDSRKLPGELN
jgi:hypothetical protein